MLSMMNTVLWLTHHLVAHPLVGVLEPLADLAWRIHDFTAPPSERL